MYLNHYNVPVNLLVSVKKKKQKSGQKLTEKNIYVCKYKKKCGGVSHPRSLTLFQPVTERELRKKKCIIRTVKRRI